MAQPTMWQSGNKANPLQLLHKQSNGGALLITTQGVEYQTSEGKTVSGETLPMSNSESPKILPSSDCHNRVIAQEIERQCGLRGRIPHTHAQQRGEQKNSFHEQ
jgi:hypothetical protein